MALLRQTDNSFFLKNTVIFKSFASNCLPVINSHAFYKGVVLIFITYLNRSNFATTLDSDGSKIVPPYDVSAATVPCIQKSTFNQSELD